MNIECAGFEAGNLLEFDGSYTDVGCIAEASEDVAYVGSWSGKFWADDATEDAYVYWTFVGEDEVYARFYCYFHTLPASLDYYLFMKFKDTSGNAMLILNIDMFNSSSYLYSYCGGNDTWYHAGDPDPEDVGLQSDRWYCFEVRLRRHSATGIIQVWVDGVLEIDEQNIDTQGILDQIGRAEFGVMNDHSGQIIYFDSICIDDERIYCLGLTSTSTSTTSTTSTSTTSTSTSTTSTTSTSTSTTSTSTTSTSTTSTSTTSTSTTSTSTTSTSTSSTSTSSTMYIIPKRRHYVELVEKEHELEIMDRTHTVAVVDKEHDLDLIKKPHKLELVEKEYIVKPDP